MPAQDGEQTKDRKSADGAHVWPGHDSGWQGLGTQVPALEQTLPQPSHGKLKQFSTTQVPAFGPKFVQARSEPGAHVTPKQGGWQPCAALQLHCGTCPQSSTGVPAGPQMMFSAASFVVALKQLLGQGSSTQ